MVPRFPYCSLNPCPYPTYPPTNQVCSISSSLAIKGTSEIRIKTTYIAMFTYQNSLKKIYLEGRETGDASQWETRHSCMRRHSIEMMVALFRKLLCNDTLLIASLKSLLMLTFLIWGERCRFWRGGSSRKGSWLCLYVCICASVDSCGAKIILDSSILLTLPLVTQRTCVWETTSILQDIYLKYYIIYAYIYYKH